MLERERETVMCAIEKKRKKQRNILKRERRYANVTGCEPQPCIYLPDVSDDCYLRSLQETILFFNIYLMHNKLNSKNHFKKLKKCGEDKGKVLGTFPTGVDRKAARVVSISTQPDAGQTGLVLSRLCPVALDLLLVGAR